jgi:hypothetical protein
MYDRGQFHFKKTLKRPADFLYTRTWYIACKNSLKFQDKEDKAAIGGTIKYTFFQEVDTALIKLYAKSHPDKLTQFVRNEDWSCDVDDCSAVLQSLKRYHGLALLYLKLNRHDEAFSLWSQLLKGQDGMVDDQFPGLGSFIDNLEQ